MMSLRESVVVFAEAMERELRCNDKAKGERGWIHEDVAWLVDRLREEVDELALAIDHAKTYRDERRVILAEAADVANFAMMIADRVGALAPPDHGGKATRGDDG